MGISGYQTENGAAGLAYYTIQCVYYECASFNFLVWIEKVGQSSGSNPENSGHQR